MAKAMLKSKPFSVSKLSTQDAQRMTDALLHFSTPLGAKELFKSQNEDKVDALVKTLGGHGSNIGNYHAQAVNQLWKALPDAERDEWAEKARQTLDVGTYVLFDLKAGICGSNSCWTFRNQDEIVVLLGTLFEAIVQSGRVGKVEFSANIALRRPDGELVGE